MDLHGPLWTFGDLCGLMASFSVVLRYYHKITLNKSVECFSTLGVNTAILFGTSHAGSYVGKDYAHFLALGRGARR